LATKARTPTAAKTKTKCYLKVYSGENHQCGPFLISSTYVSNSKQEFGFYLHFFCEFNFAFALIRRVIFLSMKTKKVVVQPKRLFQNKDDLVIKAENAVIKM